MIKRITFTGLDDQTNIEDLVKLEKLYYNINIEWGILFSNQCRNRYPQQYKVAEALGKLKNYCAHLCGGKFTEVYNNPSVVSQIYYLFPRIQLNFNCNTKYIELKNIIQLLSINPTKEFILQYNKSNQKLIEELLEHDVKNWSILFDSSGGRGKIVTRWPKPLSGVECSYSGGLGPDTLDCAISNIYDIVGHWNFGVDMESNIRTNDLLDIDKVHKCLAIVSRWQIDYANYKYEERIELL